ncbi:hypothetical protein [Bradyrhizobium cenepequi]
MAASRFTDANMQSMLSSRMGWNMDDPKRRLHECRVHKLNDDEMILFIITSDRQPLMVRDDANLYPSDALVTQLRLLEN